MVTLEETAIILGVGTQTVAEWAAKGRIDFVLLNSEYYFTKDSIDSFTAKTGIQLIKPMDFNSESEKILIREFESGEIEKVLSKYHEEHNTLNPEEIEKLLKDEQENIR